MKTMKFVEFLRTSVLCHIGSKNFSGVKMDKGKERMLPKKVATK